MSRKQKAIRTDIGWSDANSIMLFGKDFPTQILGHLNLGDMGFLEFTGRFPTPAESKIFNAMVVTLVEHGITPSALFARMTYLGAPESLQGAVAAGLNGLGTVFLGSIEGAAKLLYKAMPSKEPAQDLQSLAAKVISNNKSRGNILPGIGHPFHKPIDPRTPRLQQIAAETGFNGPYFQFMDAIAKQATLVNGKSMSMNATGAIGALCCEMGFDWKICRRLGVMARTVGLVGHILEEYRNPMAQEVWHRIKEVATEHMHPTSKEDPK